MDFFGLIEKRHSVRKFKEKEISEEDLKQILHAANRAPSAGNLQSYKLVVVKDAEQKKKLHVACFNQLRNQIDKVPAILVFFADSKNASSKYGERGADFYCILDATIACTYAQLAAEALGISSVWIGAFDAEKVAKALNAPKHLIPVSVLPLGYADEKPHITGRRSLSELVKEDKF